MSAQLGCKRGRGRGLAEHARRAMPEAVRATPALRSETSQLPLRAGGALGITGPRCQSPIERHPGTRSSRPPGGAGFATGLLHPPKNGQPCPLHSLWVMSSFERERRPNRSLRGEGEPCLCRPVRFGHSSFPQGLLTGGVLGIL